MRRSTWLRTAGWILLLVAVPVVAWAAPIGQEGGEAPADVLWITIGLTNVRMFRLLGFEVLFSNRRFPICWPC